MAADIRRAVPDEWRACRDVRLAALAEAPYAFSSTLEREVALGERAWRERLERGATFLAWLGDEPAGTVTGLATDRGEAGGPAWELVGMWVDPRVRGAGVAAALVEAVAGHARGQGARRLLLWVTEVNARARACYERAGFTCTGARELVRPDEPGRWQIQMARELS